MKKRPTAPATPEADAILRGVLSSPEYTEALKARALAGKITATEANLLRSLGVAVPIIDRDTAARENMRRIPVATRRVMSDIDRMALGPESTRLRVIRAGTIIAVGYDTAVPVDPGTKPTTTPQTTDDELLPPRTT